MEWAAFMAKLVALVILVSLLASFVTTLDPGAFEGSDKPSRFGDVPSRLAALRAGELGTFQAEEHRRTGGFASKERLTQIWAERHGTAAGSLEADHKVDVVLPARNRYLVTVFGGPGGGNSFTLDVDAVSRTVVASCLDRTDRGCRRARWDTMELARVAPEQLLP